MTQIKSCLWSQAWLFSLSCILQAKQGMTLVTFVQSWQLQKWIMQQTSRIVINWVKYRSQCWCSGANTELPLWIMALFRCSLGMFWPLSTVIWKCCNLLLINTVRKRNYWFSDCALIAHSLCLSAAWNLWFRQGAKMSRQLVTGENTFWHTHALSQLLMLIQGVPWNKQNVLWPNLWR